MREEWPRRAAGRDRRHVVAAGTWAASDVRKAMPDKTVEWLKPGGAARLEFSRVGVAQILRVRASPLRIASLGAQGRPNRSGPGPEPDVGKHPERAECLHLALHRAGRSVYSDEARDETPLGRGAAMLIDGDRPCAAIYPDGASLAVWSLPRTLLAPCLPELPAAAALDGEPARLVATQAALVEARASRLPPPLRRALVDHLCHLVALAFACRDIRVAASRAAQRAGRRARIHAYLEARFRDPRLSVERAAVELGMSRRWLQAQFPEGRGFADALARRRLEASIALLRDPGASHLTVTEIAFAAGFNDLSTFHRRFRRRYGLTPRAARSARREGRFRA
jgi:AraC-like DNA-binding protein